MYFTRAAARSSALRGQHVKLISTVERSMPFMRVARVASEGSSTLNPSEVTPLVSTSTATALAASGSHSMISWRVSQSLVVRMPRTYGNSPGRLSVVLRSAMSSARYIGCTLKPSLVRQTSFLSKSAPLRSATTLARHSSMDTPGNWSNNFSVFSDITLFRVVIMFIRFSVGDRK